MTSPLTANDYFVLIIWRGAELAAANLIFQLFANKDFEKCSNRILFELLAIH